MIGHNSTNPGYVAKIGPVGFEIIGLRGFVSTKGTMY